jgi:TusA-related sulfurtransferase
MLARALKAHPEVELLADDPAARADLDAFCSSTGCALVALAQEGPVLRALVRRAG